MILIKNHIFSTMLLVLLTLLQAQETSLSLKDIFIKASKSSDELKIIDMDYKISKEGVKQVRSGALPNINFSTDLMYASQSLKSQGATGSDISKIFDRIDGYTVGWSGVLSQPLLTFGRATGALKAAKQSKKLYSSIKNIKKDTYYLSLIQSFSVSYIAQENVISTRKMLDRTNRLLKKIELESNGGAATKTDLLRMQSLVKKNEAELIQAVSKENSAKAKLSVLTGIEELRNANLVIKMDNWQENIQNRNNNHINPQLNIKQIETKLSEINVQTERAKLFPQISLIGQISNKYMIIDTSDMTKTYVNYLNSLGQPAPPSLPFSIPEVKDYWNSDFFNYAIGLQLTYPIFSGLRNSSSYNKAKWAYKKAEKELEKTKKETETAIKEAKKLVEVMKKYLEATKLFYDSSLKLATQADKDYKAGFIDITELLKFEEERDKAKIQLCRTETGLIMAISNYRMTVGLPVYEEIK